MKRVLVTGATGFLGTIIKGNLDNCQVTGISRSNSDINIDLATEVICFGESYDIVIHCAGKAHSIPRSEKEKLDFFHVNVTGTLNLLKSIEQFNVFPESFVFISSVAVYGLNRGILVNENTPLQAEDAYGRSKIRAEKLVEEWCKKNNVICTILRLPLLVGKNPPGNLGAMIDGIKRGYYFNVARGQAKKSMVFVEDIPQFILKASKVGGVYNLTDGYHPCFSELSELVAKQVGKRPPRSMPLWLILLIAKLGDSFGPQSPINSNKLQKITSDLTFDDSKARRLLGWNPTPVLEGFKIK